MDWEFFQKQENPSVCADGLSRGENSSVPYARVGTQNSGILRAKSRGQEIYLSRKKWLNLKDYKSFTINKITYFSPAKL